MAGVLDYITTSFFHKPVDPDPYQTHWTVGIAYKFSSMTGTFLFFASCFVFIREVIGDHIHCITDANDGASMVSIDISISLHIWIVHEKYLLIYYCKINK